MSNGEKDVNLSKRFGSTLLATQKKKEILQKMEKIDNNNVFIYENIDVRLDPKVEKNNKLSKIMIEQIKTRRVAFK